MILNKQGLHARPAANFVQIASQYTSQITVQKGKESVNGKSIMGILMLGIHYNSKIKIVVQGSDAPQAIKELEEFLIKSDG